METKSCDFFNIQTGKVLYGLKVKHNGRWIYAGDDAGQFLFETEAERDAKRKEVKNMTIPIK